MSHVASVVLPDDWELGVDKKTGKLIGVVPKEIRPPSVAEEKTRWSIAPSPKMEKAVAKSAPVDDTKIWRRITIAIISNGGTVGRADWERIWDERLEPGSVASALAARPRRIGFRRADNTKWTPSFPNLFGHNASRPNIPVEQKPSPVTTESENVVRKSEEQLRKEFKTKKAPKWKRKKERHGKSKKQK